MPVRLPAGVLAGLTVLGPAASAPGAFHLAAGTQARHAGERQISDTLRDRLVAVRED